MTSLILIVARCVLRLFSWMPAGMPYWLAERGAGIWMRLSPGKRKVAARNLELCYPDMDAVERTRLVHDTTFVPSWRPAEIGTGRWSVYRACAMK
jgi:lauroyl/myristoyl acyltransferase